MKIDKIKNKWGNGKTYLYHYYDNKKGNWVFHGLCNDYSFYGIGYHYHSINKGFWLLYKDRI